MQRTFDFTFWLAPESRELLDWSNALLDVGADDCSPGLHCGEAYVSFHRDAATFEDAVRSAQRDVTSAGCRVIRLEIAAEQLAAWT
jgi:hypothetical protein